MHGTSDEFISCSELAATTLKTLIFYNYVSDIESLPETFESLSARRIISDFSSLPRSLNYLYLDNSNFTIMSNFPPNLIHLNLYY